MSAAADTPVLRRTQPQLLDAVGWIDARVRDASGKRLGRVAAVYADRDGNPWWIVVRRRGHRLVAPVSAVQPIGRSELLINFPESALAPGVAEMTDALHETLIRRFGLDRRRPAHRRRGHCVPPRERRRTRQR